MNDSTDLDKMSFVITKISEEVRKQRRGKYEHIVVALRDAKVGEGIKIPLTAGYDQTKLRSQMSALRILLQSRLKMRCGCIINDNNILIFKRGQLHEQG